MKPMTESSSIDVVRQRELQWVKSNTASNANGLRRANERVYVYVSSNRRHATVIWQAYVGTQADANVNFGWHRGMEISSRSTDFFRSSGFFLEVYL